MKTIYRKGNGKKLVLYMTRVINLVVHLKCPNSDYLQENDMEKAHKAKHEESLSENIDEILK